MMNLSDKGSQTRPFSFSIKILFGLVPGYLILNIILTIISGTFDAAAAMFFSRSIDEAIHLGTGGSIAALFAYIAAYVFFLHAVPYVLSIFSDIVNEKMKLKLSIETVEMTVRRALQKSGMQIEYVSRICLTSWRPLEQQGKCTVSRSMFT